LIEENVDHRLVEEFFLNDEKIVLKKKPLLSQTTLPIRAQKIIKAKDLDDYFIKMAKMSKASQKMSGLPLALGCEDIGSLLVSAIRYEPIYILPTIDTNDPSAQTPYYDLAWPLIEKSVEYSAGLMEDFHDIVNHPPYVQSIKLVQAGGGSYRARWEDILETRPTGRTEELFYDVKYRGFQKKYDYVKERKLVTNLNGTFMTGIPIQITIHFGSDAYAVEERIDPASIEVMLGGEMAAGQMTGPATWEGSFLPRVGENRGSREFKLEIGARDLHDHFPRSGYPDKGYLLDVDPETPAKSSSRSPYDWLGYTQGPDKNHSISVFGEPAAEPKPKEEIIESGGGCPIPPGAQLSESNIVKGYKKLIGNVYRNVGPYLRWYDSSKTQLASKSCYDAQGRKTGTALHWYEDGTLSRRSGYEAGELNGADIVYHRNGKAQFETHYSKGKKSGPYRSFRQDGSLMSSGQYTDDKKTGNWSFYDATGRLTAEQSLADDKLNGPSVYYRVQKDTQPGDPRRIDYKCEYKNGQKNGMYIEYYEDGTIYQTIEYRDGKKDGLMKEFFSSGEIKLEIPFRDDKRHGTMVEYARNGEIVYKWILENGDPVKKLDKDGNVVEVYKKKDR
jgi:antitoxin component YwqK of YwqJK toxin-antitoxin module